MSRLCHKTAGFGQNYEGDTNNDARTFAATNIDLDG